MKHLYFPEYKVEKESQRWNTDLASIHHAPLPLFRISNPEWRKKLQNNSLLSHFQFLVGCLCFRGHVCKTITRIASFPAQSGPPAKKLHFDRESVDFLQNLCVFPFFHKQRFVHLVKMISSNKYHLAFFAKHMYNKHYTSPKYPVLGKWKPVLNIFVKLWECVKNGYFTVRL